MEAPMQYGPQTPMLPPSQMNNMSNMNLNKQQPSQGQMGAHLRQSQGNPPQGVNMPPHTAPSNVSTMASSQQPSNMRPSGYQTPQQQMQQQQNFQQPFQNQQMSMMNLNQQQQNGNQNQFATQAPPPEFTPPYAQQNQMQQPIMQQSLGSMPQQQNQMSQPSLSFQRERESTQGSNGMQQQNMMLKQPNAMNQERQSHYSNMSAIHTPQQHPFAMRESVGQQNGNFAQNVPNALASRSSNELMSKIRNMCNSRDTYIEHLMQTLSLQQREKEELDFLLTQVQKEVAEGGRITGRPETLFRGFPNMTLPPFYWIPSQDYQNEFAVEGQHGETVTKRRDFEDQGWVIPVAGSLKMARGAVYRWSLLVEKKCSYRPQMQFGIHGLNHEKPWRLVTTSRCSRSRDDDPWADRPDGDKLVDQGDIIHVVIDLRGETENTFGTFVFAVNDEPFEKVFDDLPLNLTLIPVVSMGGDGSSVSLIKF